jgi:MerR family copper efflux transcriptional regulator
MILRGKQAGFSLPQIGEMLDAPDGRARKDLLRRHRDELNRRIDAIQVSKTMIEHAIDCSSGDFTRCPHFQLLVQELATRHPLERSRN